MIKILYVALGENVNGTEKFVIDLITNLRKENFDIYFAIPYESNLSRRLEELNIKWLNFENDTLKKFTLKGIYNLYNIIRKYRIDIVHSNSGILPCLVGKMLRVKATFETRHGLFFTPEMLHNLSKKTKYKEKIKQYLSTFQIAISHNDKNSLIKYFEMKPENIKVIYNGINLKMLDEFKEKKLNSINYEVFRFLNAGRFTYQKAQDVLLKAVNILSHKYDKFSLTIIGEGEEKNNLLRYIKEYNLEKFVKIEKYRNDILDYFTKYDSVVLSSRFEGVPYVMLDSMAIGLPVIATNVGGINNVITDKFDGLVVNHDSPEELSEAMYLLANDKKLYISLQHNAMESIKKYSLEHMSKEYENLYMKFIKK